MNPDIAAYRHVDRLRVRWAEIDMQKIVFNGHYLTYFDTAVASYWRSLAMPYEQTMHGLGGDLYVKKATLEYHASARYDDLLDVGMRCARIGNSSLLFQGTVFRADQPLVGCELVYVFADPATQTSKPVPQPLRDILTGFEAGETMTRVEQGGWDRLGADARALRTAVFVDEQQIPAELEWDAADANAVHAVAYNRLGAPLATGRLLPEVDGSSRLGRMAVVQPMRGGGVGRLVLQALVDAARARGDREVVLHAQRSAIVFYRRAGFVERGPAFEEAGIPHQEMALPLQR
jgi:YbgC/YbaW family acyl-CoA thioester hydrolase